MLVVFFLIANRVGTLLGEKYNQIRGRALYSKEKCWASQLLRNENRNGVVKMLNMQSAH